MKKAIIFAPHQDDEINIAGGILSSLLANNIEVKVVYSTNGDYCTKASTRISECKKALKVFGISEENIYFMGYSDQTREEDTHLYMTEKNSIWKTAGQLSQSKKYSVPGLCQRIQLRWHMCYCFGGRRRQL